MYSAQIQKDSLLRDTAKVEKRHFSTDFREKYSGEEYIYEKDLENKGWFTRFKEWLARVFKKWFNLNSDLEAGNIADIFIKIFYVLIIIAVVFIIVKAILNREGRWVFGKSSDRKIINVEDIEQNIGITDFRKLINRAIADREYRSAVRFYYLWMLKELSNKELIAYDVEKTNNDYLYELNNSRFKNDFRYTSYLYNYVWYGEFEINEKQFEKISGTFTNILKDLKA